MRFLTALLLPMVVSATILPETIGPYHRASVAPAAVTDRAIWDEYGLKASETASYENGADKFTATVWRLQDPTGALAAFEWLRPADATPSDAAKLATQTGTRLLVAHGNYLLSFDGYKPGKEELEAVLNGLPNVDVSSLPVLIGYLPTEGLKANSERYVTGPAGLQKFDPAIPPSVAGFRFGAEAQLGEFHSPKGDMKVAVFNYPTAQIAMQQTAEFEKLPGAMVKRSGPLIAVVLSPPDADSAEHVLGQIRYQAEVTRNEYVPTIRDNPGFMLMNIFILTGILVALALFSGLFFGGLRALRRRLSHGEDRDAMITLHLE